MFRRFVETLYPSQPAEFPSDFPLDEAVGRLRQVVEPNLFRSLFKQSAVGRVGKDRVRLQRVMAVISILAILTSAVHSVGLPSNLAGSTPTRVLELLIFLFFGLAFVAGGYFFLRFRWWLSRGDIKFLSETISTALTN
jgi:hypothetical protein